MVQTDQHIYKYKSDYQQHLNIWKLNAKKPIKVNKNVPFFERFFVLELS